MQKSALIAVIEDEEHLAQGLVFNLRAEGYSTHHEADGVAALGWLLAPASHPAAVLLDVMLPGIDGFAITRALREAECFVPVLLLTARGRTEDILQGFEAGADDYLPKPFDLNVLLARLGSLLRRKQWLGKAGTVAISNRSPGTVSETSPTSETAVEAKSGLLQLGGRTVDFDNLEIRGAGETIRLTVMEADLLRYLVEHSNQVVSRKEVLEEVWHVQGDTDTRPIDNFIVRLRRYLEPQPGTPVYFLTVRGVGYRFVGPTASI